VTTSEPRGAFVRVRDRQTQAVVEEPVYAAFALSLLYEHRLSAWLVNLACKRHWVSTLYGLRMHSRASRALIQPLIEQFDIDPTEAELDVAAYPHFNAFFERRLKPDARVYSDDPTQFGSPGDGKLLVYPELATTTHLPIKGLNVSLAALLDDESMANRYCGGAAIVLRLAPQDYHRFHFPVAGLATEARTIPGIYHSVNPIAVKKVPGLFGLNKRMSATLHTQAFGQVVLVEVGAIMIGTIMQNYVPGAVVAGQEKGHFRYGGSTIIVLFEPACITFDDDLLRDSASGLEVRVKAGEVVGRARA